jgi:hypothetical protein
VCRLGCVSVLPRRCPASSIEDFKHVLDTLKKSRSFPYSQICSSNVSAGKTLLMVVVNRVDETAYVK